MWPTYIIYQRDDINVAIARYIIYEGGRYRKLAIFPIFPMVPRESPSAGKPQYNALYIYILIDAHRYHECIVNAIGNWLK